MVDRSTIVNNGSISRPPNKKLIVGIIISSFCIFIYYLLKNYNVNYYDESGYIAVSDQILTRGLFNIVEPLRTYLYPLLITITRIFTNGEISNAKIILCIIQYVFYMFTIFLIARYSLKYFNSNIIYYGVLLFGLLNPYLVQSTTLLLTDLLASCCIAIAIFYSTFNDFKKNKDYYIVFICIYSAIMIRPSSLIILPFIGFILIARKLMLKELNYFKGITAAILSSVIFLPQLYNNIKQYNHWTPLIHQELYEFQSRLAATYLKYGTVVIPDQVPTLVYQTPFNVNPNTSILELILQNPIAFLCTFLVHIFGALDWGYIDTYIINFYPSSRIIASIFLYLFWSLAMLGTVIFIRKRMTTINDRFIGMALISPFIGYSLFIGTTVVESRFGYPLFILILPFAGYALYSIYGKLIKSRVNRKKLIQLISVYISSFLIVLVSCFSISYWIDLQTDRIDWLNKADNGTEFQVMKKYDNEIIINGKENWEFVMNKRGYKIIQSSDFSYLPQDQYEISVSNSKGDNLVFDDKLSKPDRYTNRFWEEPSHFLISISNTESGWENDYTPSAEEIGEFFRENNYKLNYMLSK